MSMSKLAPSMRKLILAAALTTLMAGPAAAQGISPFQAQSKPTPTQEEVDKQEKLDSDYKSTLKKLPNQKTVDPWGTVRQPPVKSTKTKQQ